ncbi:MAG: O-antigen ligase family protein [Hyphomicrobium sp.]
MVHPLASPQRGEVGSECNELPGEGAIAWGRQSRRGNFNKRLEFYGRAAHPIFGAGAIAIGAIAAVTLLAYPGGRRTHLTRLALAGMALAMMFAVVMTGSRGPLIALVSAFIAGLIAVFSKSRLVPLACAFGSWVLVTSSVLFEGPIKEALCPVARIACRSSLRQDVWSHVANTIAQHPLWGSGYGLRFVGVPHAHNGYFGLALNYGIPLLILFICLMATALWRAAAIKSKGEKFFIVASLVFANAFMGSDLSDPMRYFNTHYLFLWFPLFLAFVSEKSAPEVEPPGARMEAGMASGNHAAGAPQPES